ncbi:mannose-1-phosphate guanylyltransferase/mannose-6-phosphate isomerase [Oceanidesulfovibrio marinus]|uniref:mannose-1-phosphate guanylyltransferase n=1 Tax=Oceanidesulfovibrio marinus TaxID=370038 RepID=A0ABX6NCU4_9BACT|nr:mannose-1-phosphate guanylyltransferase/mannose-6-phosphate isomerase [Oceanidesulfovibrio marinus]QJT07617.1 mannose-1-phosphate guanylyltransferase/mannose-6-phosphate isomerase [Oceanidesulfovibrio marinus]
MICPVILCGGSGTRLWPLSRKLYPKQFLPLVDSTTMFQTTVLRAGALPGTDSPLILCNEEHRFLVAEQLRLIDAKAAAIILEPVARNTAPAVAVAALRALEQDQDAMLLVMPADHVIRNTDNFTAAVQAGIDAARQGKLITFGVVPTAAETGYGYIQKAASLDNAADVFTVGSFVEKPNAATAQQYLDSGEYLWNSGMFMFRADRYLHELETLDADILAACRTAFQNAKADLDFLRLDADAFTKAPDNSVDYAIMEKTSDAVVIPLDADWSDVGSWTGLWEIKTKDEHGNALDGNVLVEDVEDSYINATSRMVAAVGVSGHVIVETTDAVLVAPKDRVQDIKAIVERLQQSDRSEAFVHRKVYRPWGSYENVDIADRFQVKRIEVKPGATLSLQKHHHRAEHWVVVKGTALVTRGEDEIILTEDQSTYIPLGTVHRLHNPGRIPLELIEVQTGSYLGEDDIVRLGDVYGRSGMPQKVR